MNEPIVFSYKIYKNFACPIIQFTLFSHKNSTDIEAYVDSGASVSLLTILEAQRLGIDFQIGRKIYSIVGDGSLIPVYLHKLVARIGNISFKATVGFSPKLGVGFNLLGRQDFFKNFDITFSDSDKTISFMPR